MPQVHYPFIDVAVHPAIRVRFAAGDAVVLFSRDMTEVLWANGAGARLFGQPAIYDLIEGGPDRKNVAFRQLSAAAAQLAVVGDRRDFLMRIQSGFRSAAAQAQVSLIVVGRHEAVMFSASAQGGTPRLADMLAGFDDPDTHMALMGAEGEILAASGGFTQLGVMQDTSRALIAAACRNAEGLVKRPIPSGSGYLPAAIGRLADDLFLLFCVETAIGRMDAPDGTESFTSAPVSAGNGHSADHVIHRDGNAVAAVAQERVPEEDRLPTPSVPAPETEDADGALHLDEAQETPHPELPAVSDEIEEGVAPEPGEIPDEAGDAELADLTALDGASEQQLADGDAFGAGPDDAEAPASSVGEADTGAGMTSDDADPTELASDMADASPEENRAPLPDVGSPELAADVVETSATAEQAPEDFVPEQDTSDAEAATDFDAASRADVPLADQHQHEPAQKDAGMVPYAVENPEASDQPFQSAAPSTNTENAGNAAAPAVTEATRPNVPNAPDGPFRFDRDARPVRFVWKLDSQGVFAEVSDEFARTVGPHSGDIIGRSFNDLAGRYGLDRDGQIAALLERLDTWSGRTVKWPVEGTELVVPVDLAALPTYSRNREFDGFRGFGIIRVGDAEPDPNGYGLALAPEALATSEDDDGGAGAPTGEQAAGEDEFRGEVPALDIVSNPLGSLADKVIRIEERRARHPRGSLSASEQAALKEIARQLEPFGKRPNEDLARSDDGPPTADFDLPETEHVGTEPETGGGDPERHPAADTAIEATADAESGHDAPGEQAVERLFEDLGSSRGLTSYAIDQVPMAILIHAGDRLIRINDEFRRLTGYASTAELDAAGGLDALINRRDGAEGGVYLVRSDGTDLLVSARLQSVRYEGSSALMLALTPAAEAAVAIAAEPPSVAESEPARRIAALTVEVEELRSILETATDGVIVLDTEGRIRSMNRSASALFNFDDGEIRGKPFAMLFAHESQKSVQDYLAGLAGHGVASLLNDGREVIGREASGGFIPLFMTMGRMPGSNSYCAVIRDITQWKRSEEELRAAKRAAETANQHKTDFLARVSHEIRTPLNAIIGFSDMIASEHFGPAGHSRYVEYASDIGRSGRHVLDIVNDLLDISKIEAGEMDLEFSAVGINDCISEAVSLVQPQANAQRVIIRTSLSQAVPDVVADLRSIKQIALNILANAIRYTPSGGQIVVSTAYEQSGSVTLRIRDTGVGMSKAELEQAMRPFGQVAPGTRQRGDGTGLGLPLTKAMTEANRASFAIHSAPNEGTLVEITFPPQRVLAD